MKYHLYAYNQLSILLFSITLLVVSCTTNKSVLIGSSPETEKPHIHHNTDSSTYSFYKQYISPVDGDRCTMYPSCSAYSKEAFIKYGFFKGFIVTCDRLTRCGNDLHLYSHCEKEGKVYAIDPIGKNNTTASGK